MNLRIVIIVAAIGVAGNICQGQGEYQAILVQQRAKGIQDKNNEMQKNLGAENPAIPGAPAAPFAPPAPAAPVLTPAQQALLSLNTDMAAIRGDARPEQLAALTDGLQANAHLGGKPSAGAIKKLSADLAAALASKALPPAQRGRVEQDIVAIFNDTTMPQTQYNDVVDDVPTVLKRAGIDATLTAAVAADLKAIAAEVRKKA